VATTPSRAQGVLAPSYLGLGVEFPRITATTAPGLPVLALDLGDDFSVEVKRNLATTVRAAIEQSGFALPLARGVRVTSSAPILSHANLALPIALAVLEAVGEIPAGTLDGVLACAGLSLTGKLMDDRGTFLAVHHANEAGLAAAIIAGDATRAPSTLGPMALHAADTLREVVEALHRAGVSLLPEARYRARYTSNEPRDPMALYLSASTVPEHLRLPVALAAAGDMNLLIVTERGVGSIAGRAMLSVLPPPNAEEAVAITDMASLYGPVRALAVERPLAAPHHTVSAAGLVGSRASTATGVVPGELARAHLGVFVLDQIPEFSREAVEVMREAITEGTATVLRTLGGKTRRVVFPARVRLVASMTPRAGGSASRRGSWSGSTSSRTTT
jgi:magnesium chelatase family protein